MEVGLARGNPACDAAQAGRAQLIAEVGGDTLRSVVINARRVTVADLIAYRRVHDLLIERMVETDLPTVFGDFRIVGYRSLVDEKHHVALVKGEVTGAPDVLVRVHSECMTGDTFHSLRCDCGEQLEASLALIETEGRGVLLYLAQEGRGIGLLNKLKAYRLQDGGLDTVDANLELGLPVDLRHYGIGAQILVDLGLTTIRLLTNNPKKIHGMQGFGLTVTAQLPIVMTSNPHNEAYLRAKAERLGHTIHHQGLALDEEMLRTNSSATRRGLARRARSRPVADPRSRSSDTSSELGECVHGTSGNAPQWGTIVSAWRSSI